jgi:hypothetical protein
MSPARFSARAIRATSSTGSSTSRTLEARRSRPLLAASFSGDSEPRCAIRAPTPAFARTNVVGRPDRAYLGYIDGGMVILTSRIGAAKDGGAVGLPPALFRLYPHGRAVLRPRPPDRRRCTRTEGADWPKLVGCRRTNRDDPVPIATCPLPPPRPLYADRARYGARLREPAKPNAWKSTASSWRPTTAIAPMTPQPLPAGQSAARAPEAGAADPDKRRSSTSVRSTPSTGMSRALHAEMDF